MALIVNVDFEVYGCCGNVDTAGAVKRFVGAEGKKALDTVVRAGVILRVIGPFERWRHF